MATQNLIPKNGEFNYCIQGINVTFPCKAYPSQLAVMNKILMGLTRQQNCLIESPTGSGKSLALLCSCLAWQKALIEKNKMNEEIMQYQPDKFTQNVISHFEETNLPSPEDEECKKHRKKKTKGVCYDEPVSFSPRDTKNRAQAFPKFEEKFDDDFNDFQVPRNFRKLKKGDCCTKSMELESTTNTSVSKFVSKVPSADVKQTSTRSPVKLSFSHYSPKTVLSQKMCGSSNFLHKDFSSAREIISPFKATLNYNDVSICQNATDFGNTTTTPSSSALVSNGVPVNDNSHTDVNTLTNMAGSVSASNTQGFEETTPILNSIPFQPRRVPQIYFGTRTHKQITQIVRELKKTVYQNVRMCILSSRERTCIHEKVSKSNNINNDCVELLDPQGPGCHYFYKALNIDHERLRMKGLSDCWDLEDLVKMGRKLNICPYYTMRNLMCAEIIFCPYNYLIDPRIREKMNIRLENNIIVFDEAHNIEDSAREAASFTVTEQQLQDALTDIEKMSYLGYKTHSHDVVFSVLSGLCSWISKHANQLTDYNDFNKLGKVWSGEELVAMLSEIKAGPENFSYIQKHFNIVALDEKNEDLKELMKPTLNASTSSLIQDLLRIFRSLYTEELKYMQDYKAVITKEISSRPTPPKTGFVSKSSKEWIFSLNFWCLNPGVAFSSIKDKIHSLIVASGTLSPMKTFQSELNVLFPLTFEANHVINTHQVWIGSIGYGPSETCLKAIYQQIDTFKFQDELGDLILQVCQIVPHGVLCFFPSYGALEKLTHRWQLTGLWQRLENYKVIVCELQKNGKKTFEEIIHDYYDIIADEQMNGALFLAVYRGKVSEGLDFADNNARAVISIGIPFPSFKDMQVDLKRKYNSKFCHKRQLMNGSEWYESRAFRALNQALGRCIRHRNDWGALILVDDRFKERRNITGLSKWIRNCIVHYDKFEPAIESLSNFIKNQQFMESQSLELLSESIIVEPSSPSLFE